MKLTDQQKQQIIVGSIAAIDQSLAVLRGPESVLTEAEINLLTADLPDLYKVAAQLRIAEAEGDQQESEILREMIQDLKVVQLAQMELHNIRRTREQRKKLFSLLQSMALKTAASVAVAVI
jgi:hypothetical protein